MNSFVVRRMGLLAIGLAGCGTTELWWYSCPKPDRGHLAFDGTPDPCHYKDQDAGAEEGCPPGACVLRPTYWDGPFWVWVGPDPAVMKFGSKGPPECPLGTAGPAGDWHADLLAPPACAICTCEPSTGSCELPSVFTASTVTCGQPGGTSIAFDAPVSWDGKCDTTNQVPANAAKSLTIAPVTVTEESCPVGPPVAALTGGAVPYVWQTLVRTCHGQEWSGCGSPSASCVPKGNQPSSEFRLCVMKEGKIDYDCDDRWPEQRVIYKDVKDDRNCLTECTCGAPIGSKCTAEASVYQNSDNTCGGPTVVDIGIGSTSEACFDIVPPGKPLGSKSATSPTYNSGTCAPILGTSMGSATEQEPSTLCCRTEPLP